MKKRKIKFKKNDPQNTVTGKQEFNFLASINQHSFPGTNRSLPVNPRVGEKRQKGYYGGNERIRTIEDSGTSFALLHTHLCFLNIRVCI